MASSWDFRRPAAGSGFPGWLIGLLTGAFKTPGALLPVVSGRGALVWPVSIWGKSHRFDVGSGDKGIELIISSNRSCSEVCGDILEIRALLYRSMRRLRFSWLEFFSRSPE